METTKTKNRKQELKHETVVLMDDVIVVDPEIEYARLLEKFNGKTINPHGEDCKIEKSPSSASLDCFTR